MNKHLKKKKKKQKKKLKKLISLSILLLTISVLLFYILKIEEKDRKNSKTIIVEINYVSCPEGLLQRKQKGIIKFQYQNNQRFLKIRKSSCPKLKVGDSIEIFYLKEKDKFYEIID